MGIPLSIFDILGRIVPFDVEQLACADTPLGTGRNAKPAPLAHVPFNFDESFAQIEISFKVLAKNVSV